MQPIEANFTITKETVDNYFYAVNMNLEYVYGRFECGENISVVCEVQNKSMIFTKATPRKCAGLYHILVVNICITCICHIIIHL